MASGITNPEEHLRLNYDNFRSPVSYLSPVKIHKFYDGRITLNKIKTILSSSESYTLLRSERVSKIFIPTLSYFVRDLIQADLFCVDRLSQLIQG